ncbi:hypothetical protein [Vagococcus sp. WN89Y]|uniref:hypothetical protein n=1 Tax=Vagococcus sp. WN89Y TaxID=3457258 RepID=UPI003FCC49A5
MNLQKVLMFILLSVSLNVSAGLEQCESNGDLDWECACAILCQAGEGGLLCNCDIVP